MNKTELPKRKPTRLSEFDYSTPGAYFVTICTEKKAKILSKVVNENVIETGGLNDLRSFLRRPLQPHFEVSSNLVGEGSPLPPQYEQIKTKLTKYGEIVEKYTQLISEKYPETIVEKYVIMPNHIHLMLRIDGRGNPSPTISNVIGWYKYNITREINLTTGKIEKIFQRSFHDHIIRTEKEHLEIYKYIENNPYTWQTDCFYEK